MLATLIAMAGAAPALQTAAEPLRGSPAHLDLDVVFVGLQSVDRHLRRAAELAVRLQADYVIRNLQKVAGRGAKMELPEANAEAAILLLGELRAKKAAVGLVEMLKFTIQPAGFAPIRFHAEAPQIAALIEIGLPSLDPLIRKVASTDDEVIRERAGIVIDQILGTDMAVFFVRDRRDRETDDTKRQRLNRLLDQIDKVERNRKGKILIGHLKPPPVVSPQPK